MQEKIKRLEKELDELKEKHLAQKGMFEMTTIYLKKIQEELKQSEQNLKTVNKNLIDSINYAKYIQDAFIIQEEELKKILLDSFIFQKPKDILSGDFVWTKEYENEIYLVVGDCTGHGVPGALLSIFVISLLNQIFQNVANESPASIVNELDILMQKYLTLYSKNIKDSAELSMIKYNQKLGELTFTGAKRPLVRVRGNQVDVYKGNKFILANSELRREPLSNQYIDIKKGDVFYMFSDGFVDQFGGELNVKFSTKKALTLFQEIAKEPISVQSKMIEDTFIDWKGENNQIDDVIIFGFKI